MNRILLVNQASCLNTGYGIFGKLLLNHLKKNNIVAELGCDIRNNDHRIKNSEWKIYGNLPSNQEEENEFNANKNSVYGANIFNKVCREFKPTHVISINDPWAMSFIVDSYYKKFYNLIWMPTLDGEGLSLEYADLLNQTDIILTYQDWSKDILQKESKFISIGSAPYIPQEYFPLPNRNERKKSVGLDKFIIGTVMRNQGRKRFPELFRAFKDVLKKHPNTMLYAHCSHPETQGWNIPELLLKYDIVNNVLFTYYCNNCNFVWSSVYQEYSTCQNCASHNSNIARNDNISNSAMNIIYNCFDLYIQLSNAEGLGMPMIEAAACGTPVIATDYASMKDVVPKINGKLIKSETYQEYGSTRMLAHTFHDQIVDMLNSLVGKNLDFWRKTTYENYIKNYDINKSLELWDTAISECKPKQSWDSPTDVNFLSNLPSKDQIDKIINYLPQDFVKWCIINILGDKSKLDTYFEHKYIKRLNNGYIINNVMQKYNRYDFINELFNMRHINIELESLR